MDYQKIYCAIIKRAQNRIIDGYVEKHHILPKCMGGSDDLDNLVLLTAREHYIAHQLLVKINPNNHKLIYAANMMTVGNARNNRSYEWLRKKRVAALSEDFTGRKRQRRKWITDGVESKQILFEDEIPDGWYKGRVFSEEGKQSILNGLMKPCSEETKLKISKSKLGKKHSTETKLKISKSRQR